MFAQNLKYLRTKQHMEQFELASKLGRKSPSSISEWEKGKYTPKLKILNEIAKIFEVEIDDLMNVDLSLYDKKNHTKQTLSLDEAIAKKINNVKNEKELSTNFLSSKLNLPKSKTELYLCGKLPFTIRLVFEFAEALDVTFDDLFPTTTTEHFDEIPAILDIDEKNNTITTASGKKYVVDDKEMQQAKDFLEFLSRK